MIVKIGIILVLWVIVYQDFKYLGITWWLLPVLFIMVIVQGVQYVPIKELLIHFSINMGILLFQLAVLTIYFSLKNKKIINITKNYLGLGDVLFFIVLAMCFEPVHFVIFVAISLLIVLILFGILKMFKMLKREHIPLAGSLAVIYILTLIITEINKYNIYSSDTINSLFL